MSKHLPIKTLIGLAEDERRSRRAKARQLQRERNDVRVAAGFAGARIATNITRASRHRRKTGTTAGNMRNFQAFVDTLDSAIEQQRSAAGDGRTAARSGEARMAAAASRSSARTKCWQARGEAAEAKTGRARRAARRRRTRRHEFCGCAPKAPERRERHLD